MGITEALSKRFRGLSSMFGSRCPCGQPGSASFARSRTPGSSLVGIRFPLHRARPQNLSRRYARFRDNFGMMDSEDLQNIPTKLKRDVLSTLAIDTMDSAGT